MKRDIAPWLVVPIVALVMLPLMSFPTWVTLTVAGAAMGMMIFLMASGLTLVFGLMDVMDAIKRAGITKVGIVGTTEGQ